MPVAEKTFIMLDGVKYEWLGQSTVRITWPNGFTLYTDPVIFDDAPPKAGLILITHHHVDHCLPECVLKVRGDDTAVAAYKEGYLKHCVRDIKKVRAIGIGDTIELKGVRITGVPAYASRGFHIKGEGCGFVIEFQGQRIYFSGDTAKIKEMEALTGIDAAIVSICDNIGAIKPVEIIEAIKIIKPRLFIPVHFTPKDAPEPVIKQGMFATKDPRFFTKKYDVKTLLPIFEGTGIEVAILKMLGKYEE